MGGWGGLRQSNRWTGGVSGEVKDRVTGGQVGQNDRMTSDNRRPLPQPLPRREGRNM